MYSSYLSPSNFSGGSKVLDMCIEIKIGQRSIINSTVSLESKDFNKFLSCEVASLRNFNLFWGTKNNQSSRNGLEIQKHCPLSIPLPQLNDNLHRNKR